MKRKKHTTIKFILLYLLIIACIISLPIYLYYHLNDHNEWLGFLGSYTGSVIGGILTFLSVLLTIKFTQRHMREDKRLSIIPFLNYSIKNISISDPHDYFRDTEVEVIFLTTMMSKNEHKARFLFEVKNVGLGNAIDIEIPQIYTLHNSISEKHYVENNNSKYFYIELYDKDLFETQSEIAFDIYYKDLLENKYQQEITLNIYKVFGGEKDEDYYYDFFLAGQKSPELLK